MAKLPDATSLQRRGAPSETPGIRAPGIDYGPMAQGSKAIAEGIGQLGKGLSVMASANAEIDDYETKKKLLDFKLQTEMEFETAKREMPYGGAGYSDQWQKTWQKQAKAFVGKDDANIPASLRGKVGMALKQHEVVLMERAKREEFAEKDRATIEGLEQSLGTTRSAVEADPSRRDEMLAEGRKLIELSPITPAAKHRLDNHYSKELDKTAAITRLMKAQTAEDFDALKKDLAPEAPDKRATFSGKMFDRAPTPAERRSIFQSGGVVVNLDTNWADGDRQTGPLVVIPDNATPAQRAAAEAYAAQMADVYKQQFGSTLPPKVVTRSQNGRGRNDTIHTEPFSVNDSKAVAFFSSEEGRRLHAKVLTETLGTVPGVQFSIPHDPDKGDTGAVGKGGSEVDLARGLIAELRGGGNQVADVSGGVPEQGYAGPFSRLTLSERKAMWGQAEAQRQKLVGQVADEIKSLEGNAAAGYLMPQPMLDALGSKVEQMKDPGLTARYAATLGKASIVSQYQQRSPAENTAEIQKIREEFARRQPTPEERKMLTELEDITAKQTNMIENDKLTWAFRSGSVPVKPLDFNSDDAMTARLEHAANATERFGGPMQYFTQDERKNMQAALKAGGDGLLNLSSRMVSKWGVEHTTKALAEISDKIPEAAVAGYLWANRVNTQAAQDIATTLKRRQDPNYKPAIPPRAKTEVEAQAVLGDVYRNFPPQQRDAILKAADAIYETRNKTPNVYEADQQKMYQSIIREVVGERTDRNGKTFGGVVSTQKGMLWGSGSDKMMVLPPTWRKDLWRETLETATADDMAAAGLSMPADRAGNPVSMVKAANGKLVQVGPGQYAVALGDPDIPGKEDWLRAAAPMPKGAKSDAAAPLNTSAPFVFDLGKLEPILRRRMPTSFWGG